MDSAGLGKGQSLTSSLLHREMSVLSFTAEHVITLSYYSTWQHLAVPLAPPPAK